MKKKWLALAAGLTLFVVLAVLGGTNKGDNLPDGSAPGMLRPYVLVDGVLYTIPPVKNQILGYEPAETDWAGKLTSQVKGSEMPTQDGESNCFQAGTPYVFCEEGIAVKRDAAWYVYVPAEQE